MKKSTLMMGLMLTLTSSVSFADSISFDFKIPAFNGSGYSSHALTIGDQPTPQSLWDKLVETSYAR